MINDYVVKGEITEIILVRKNGETFIAVIDTSDLEKVKSHEGKWYPIMSAQKTVYVQGVKRNKSGKSRIKKAYGIHRFIMEPQKRFQVDHIDHDTLNNRRSNLRTVTRAQNQQNRLGASSHSKTGIRGVHWDKKVGAWYAKIRLNQKVIFVGYFQDIKEAETAVIKARKTYMPFSQEA